MTMIRQFSVGLAVVGATLITCSASQIVDIYNNTGTMPDYYQFRAGNGVEIGNEVQMDMSALGSYKPTTLESFMFVYYGNNLTGTETVRLRFYDVNFGPTGNTLGPKNLLFDSGDVGLPIPNPLDFNNGTLTFTDFVTGANKPLVGMVPETMIWSVTFNRLFAGTEAGVDLFNSPTVGKTWDNYWQKFTSGTFAGTWQPIWQVDTDGNTVPIAFGAQITTVPEPSVTALCLLGLAGLVGIGIKRRFSR
jgi:hypothetical protein